MPTVNEVAIKILVDGKEMDATLKDFDNKIKRSGESGTRAGNSISRGFSIAKVGILAAAGAITGIIIGLNKAVNAASDFTEANNKMLTVFKAVPDEARKARDHLVDAYHMSYREAAQLLGTTGDILTGLGMEQKAALDLSLQVNELAADLASFNNVQGGAEQVAHALTTGLLGEREAMKTYGIVIDETMVKEELRAKGLENLTGLALKAARAEVTMTLALTQSKNALGDVARTQNDYANVQRRITAQTENLAMKLGAVFIPIWNQVLSGILKFLDLLGEQNIAGVLYAAWEIIKEFATRIYNIFENMFGVLHDLLSGNFDNIQNRIKGLWEAIAVGWEDHFVRVKQAYDQGAVDYQAFLDGSLQAYYENQLKKDELDTELNEQRKSKIDEYWQSVEDRVKQYDGNLNQIVEEETKRQALAAQKQLAIEEAKNKAKQQSQITAFKAVGSMLGSFFGQSKAVAKAQAIIDTYAGMNRALGTGVPPWSFITAAAVFAQGIANVASISAQKYALGGEINRPTLALAGEAGPEVVAPRRTFIDVANQMIRRGEIGGISNVEIVKELKGLRDAIDNQILVAELSDDGLAIKVERGNQLLTERNF